MHGQKCNPFVRRNISSYVLIDLPNSCRRPVYVWRGWWRWLGRSVRAAAGRCRNEWRGWPASSSDDQLDTADDGSNRLTWDNVLMPLWESNNEMPAVRPFTGGGGGCAVRDCSRRITRTCSAMSSAGGIRRWRQGRGSAGNNGGAGNLSSTSRPVDLFVRRGVISWAASSAVVRRGRSGCGQLGGALKSGRKVSGEMAARGGMLAPVTVRPCRAAVSARSVAGHHAAKSLPVTWRRRGNEVDGSDTSRSVTSLLLRLLMLVGWLRLGDNVPLDWVASSSSTTGSSREATQHGGLDVTSSGGRRPGPGGVDAVTWPGYCVFVGRRAGDTLSLPSVMTSTETGWRIDDVTSGHVTRQSTAGKQQMTLNFRLQYSTPNFTAACTCKFWNKLCLINLLYYVIFLVKSVMLFVNFTLFIILLIIQVKVL